MSVFDEWMAKNRKDHPIAALKLAENAWRHGYESALNDQLVKNHPTKAEREAIEKQIPMSQGGTGPDGFAVICDDHAFADQLMAYTGRPTNEIQRWWTRFHSCDILNFDSLHKARMAIRNLQYNNPRVIDYAAAVYLIDVQQETTEKIGKIE